jgi:transcriptional regulator with XRE-family HTH domain
MRSLATDIGVTSGFISQIENGQVAPSLATLHRLANAFGVGISELFDAVPRPERPSLLRAVERRSFEVAPGVRDELLSLDPTEQLEVSTIEFAPGAASSDEQVTHGAAVEFVLVLEGMLEVDVAEETFRLGGGDALTFGGDAPHRFRNRSDGFTRVLWASAPASF